MCIIIPKGEGNAFIICLFMNYGVILSGGIGARMNLNGIPKQYVFVENKPILIYTLEKFEKCPDIDKIIVVASKEWIDKIYEWIKEYNITKFAAFAHSGETRQRSVRNGLDACMQFNPTENDIVAVHDAARPLVKPQAISDLIAGAKDYGGCLPVLPMVETVYQTDDGKSISHLLNRDTLFLGQTPEAFLLLRYREINHNISDEELDSYRGAAQLAHKYGMKIHLIPGDYSNFKLTIPSDLQKFRAICEEENR